ncbi:MAG: M23 family metallopeptidase [bacterium]|nr:M23 family metallopeptidase [bacterium]
MNSFFSKKNLLIAIFSVLIIGLFLFVSIYFQPKRDIIIQPPTADKTINAGSSSPDIATNSPRLTEPLISAPNRVTKKPFGIYITPQTSPVSPEKFTGYHTGVDFEILPGEENKEVTVSAICAGRLLLKKSASGYGGVIIESCELDGQEVTIIYGHLKLSSIALKVGQTVAAGETIGILGRGYSSETGGERKHLHLGIHRGASTNLLGYAQDKNLLGNWFNILDYLR